MTSMTMTWVAVAVVVVMMLAIASIVLRQRRQRLRRRFGPEYERTLSQRDTRGQAERELRTREKRFATLDIKPLGPQARQSYRAQWTILQEQFVDAPRPHRRRGRSAGDGGHGRTRIPHTRLPAAALQPVGGARPHPAPLPEGPSDQWAYRT
jgi:hypothetical protein